MGNYSLLRPLLFTAILLFIPNIFLAQEICDNTIDDDGDGLIDVFDPDCLCLTTSSFEHIPNGGFEEKSGCCTMLSDVNNCLEDWIILQGTPDLYDPECMTSNDIIDAENLFGIPVENTFINFGVAGSFSETFGTCLLAPLTANESYLFTSDYAQTDIFAPDMIITAQIGLYGFSTCSQLENFNYTSNPCDANPSPILLASFFTNSLTNLTWNNLELGFTPPEDIEAIFIMVTCENQNSNNQGIFLSMDNLSINPTDAQINEDTISVDGNVCDFVFFLEVPENDDYTYQWYFDGDLLPGENSASIQLNGQNPFVEGTYSVAILHPDGCYYFDEFDLVVPTIDQEEFYTICPGDSVFVAGQWWDETGDYTINYLDTISPCQILLEFHIDAFDQFDFLISDTICDGESYDFQGMSYSETGIYIDSLQTIQGCDSIFTLQLTVLLSLGDTDIISTCLEEPYEWEGMVYSESGTYTADFTTSSGCDSIRTLILTVEELITGDTLRIELYDGESTMWNGEMISTEGFYSDTTSATNGCDSIFYLEIIPLGPCVIGATFNSIMTNCITSSNGSITIIPEDLTIPYLYSIDGGTTFQDQGIFENLTVGIYNIVISDGVFCETNLGTSTIDESQSSYQASITSDTTIDAGTSILLELIESNFDVEAIYWTSMDGDCNDCPEFLVSPTTTTTYEAIIEDEFGCTSIASVTITVRETSDIYLPNIFSPNNDGINDRFLLFSDEDSDFELSVFKIYDRWGNEIFSEEKVLISQMKGWNGKMNDRLVTQGVYAYYAIYLDSSLNEQVLKGSVTLVR